MFDQNSNIHKVEKIVEKVLTQNQLQDLLYFTKIRKHWSVIVGEPLALKAIPQKLKKKTLFVQVVDSAYSHHLRFFEKNMIDLIASPEICGSGIVEKVVFRVGRKMSAPGQLLPLIQHSVPEKPAVSEARENPEAERVSRRIQDVQLQKAFRRLMNRVKKS